MDPGYIFTTLDSTQRRHFVQGSTFITRGFPNHLNSTKIFSIIKWLLVLHLFQCLGGYFFLDPILQSKVELASKHSTFTSLQWFEKTMDFHEFSEILTTLHDAVTSLDAVFLVKMSKVLTCTNDQKTFSASVNSFPVHMHQNIRKTSSECTDETSF